MKEFFMDTPSGWLDLIIRVAKIAVIGFLILQAKEWIDAGTFDTPATLTDAVLIAAGVGVLYAIQILMAPSSTPNKPQIRQ